MSSMLKIKRVHDAPDPADGARFLVDRLWPRGVAKERAHLDAWLKALAPSETLRRQFHGAGDQSDEAWLTFCAAYFAELDAGEHGAAEALEQLRQALCKGPVTLVFAARNEQRNNATALAEWLDR